MSPERIERLRRRFVKQQQEAMDKTANCSDPGAELKALIQQLNARQPERLRFPRHLDRHEAATDWRPAA